MFYQPEDMLIQCTYLIIFSHQRKMYELIGMILLIKTQQFKIHRFISSILKFLLNTNSSFYEVSLKVSDSNLILVFPMSSVDDFSFSATANSVNGLFFISHAFIREERLLEESFTQNKEQIFFFNSFTFTN